ncbi:hypothetical protein DAI22_12g179200 [Oryza sativa Japonica Group]|nr:hypothetical protein DAI22_12g179200 [Oryza sativa Japonica Group]
MEGVQYKLAREFNAKLVLQSIQSRLEKSRRSPFPSAAKAPNLPSPPQLRLTTPWPSPRCRRRRIEGAAISRPRRCSSRAPRNGGRRGPSNCRSYHLFISSSNARFLRHRQPRRRLLRPHRSVDFSRLARQLHRL